MRSEDSETAHLLGSGPVLRHNNACVRDVLTAPSNVYLNLGLNLFHSYFSLFINPMGYVMCVGFALVNLVLFLKEDKHHFEEKLELHTYGSMA